MSNQKIVKQIYHLTPNGWVKGFYKNEKGEFIATPTSLSNRVMTVQFVQDNTSTVLPGLGSEIIFTAQSTPEEQELLEELCEEYPIDDLPFLEDE